LVTQVGDTSTDVLPLPAQTVQPRALPATLPADAAPKSIAQALLRGPADIHNRTEEAIRRCMESGGWRYLPWLVAPMPSELELLQSTGFNIGSSRRLVAPLPRPKIDSPPNEKLVAGLAEAPRQKYLAALGTETESGGTGCRSVGSRDAQAKYPVYNPAAAALLADGLTELANTPKVRDALGAYTKCMAAAGIVASSQSDAQRIAEKFWDASPDPVVALDREIHIAVSDHLCRASTTDAAYSEVEGPLVDGLLTRFPQYDETVRALRFLPSP
jgi:hypothetical protein